MTTERGSAARDRKPRIAQCAGTAAVDLDAQGVRFAGRVVSFEIEAELRHRLLNGLDDSALTLARAEEIVAFEAARERTGPVTTAL